MVSIQVYTALTVFSERMKSDDLEKTIAVVKVLKTLGIESNQKSKNIQTPEPTPTPKSYSASEISVSLVNKNEVASDLLKEAVIESADSTSAIQQEGTNNEALLAFDNNIQTNWQEGVDGAGIGQSITAHFEQTIKVKCLLFKIGNWKTERYFYGNNRPSKLWLTMGDFTTLLEFPDSWEEFCVELNHPFEASSLTLTLEDVYKGTDWDDTVITDVQILYEKDDHV